MNHADHAKAALAAITAAPAKPCREQWAEYGAALLAQRKLMPSNKQFGQWVKANGLDNGLATRFEVRSNAMWMAEHWKAIVQSLHNVTAHHPTAIRQQCRQAGYDWVGETKHQTECKEKSTRTKKPAK